MHKIINNLIVVISKSLFVLILLILLFNISTLFVYANENEKDEDIKDKKIAFLNTYIDVDDILQQEIENTNELLQYDIKQINGTIDILASEKILNDLIEEQTYIKQLTEQTPYNVPNDVEGCCSYAKTYMDYRAVTNTNSLQYKLLNSEKAYTNPDNGLRMYDGRYCIALGSGYTHTIGTKVNLVLENGTVIECVLGDAKSDAHTDPTHRFHSIDGSVAEFIIDGEIFYKYNNGSGSVNFIENWDSKIIKVVIIP